MKKFIHKWSWLILFIFCIIGLFNSLVGFAAIICMLAPVAVAFFKGRFWCGHFCPRGSFNDNLLSKISKKIQVPKFLKSKWFRLLFLGLVMSGFAVQLFFAWGNPHAIGGVFVRMIIITTMITILLGTFFHQRTWCTICPMGTMAHYTTKVKTINNRIKHVSFDSQKCVDCKLCSKSCPVKIDVHSYKANGKVTNADCLKCEVCIEKCPKKALVI